MELVRMMNSVQSRRWRVNEIEAGFCFGGCVRPIDCAMQDDGAAGDNTQMLVWRRVERFCGCVKCGRATT